MYKVFRRLNSSKQTIIGEEFNPRSEKLFKAVPFEPPTSPVNLIQPPIMEDSASIRLNFDTTKYNDMLQSEGFTAQEASGLIALISEAVEGGYTAFGYKTRAEEVLGRSAEGADTYKVLCWSLRIRQDVENLELKDFAALKVSIEGIRQEVEKTKSLTREEVTRLHAGVRLDMNLEKSRVEVCNEFDGEVEAVDLKSQLKTAEEKIDLQMDKLEARMSSIKDSTKNGTQRFLIMTLSLLLVYRLVVLFK